MENLMIASSKSARPHFDSKRRVINIESCSFDYTDVGAFILTDNDKRMIEQYISEEISIPLIIVKAHAQNLIEKHLNCIAYFIDGKHTCNRDFDNRKIESLIEHYESSLLPPFFKALKAYTSQGNIQFDCPGHQGGRYFLKQPAGRQFYRFFGENIFRSDLCNADTDLGDLLIHEGPAKAAQKHAAKVYNADKTYFVMGGSTTSNSIAVASAVSPDDLILFDRNNHKSVYTSALVKEGGRPVYMQTARDHYGLIGGINIKDFDENFLREEVRKIDPERAEWQRPFRLAVIQLGTYDGTIYNAKDVVEKIGPLCDYILFDSAWVGYEQFIPLMKHASPLLLDLDENDPGIFVVQSVHKQQAGFSQTSQIHKKDKHIKGQHRYINHKCFNNAYMQYATTSPFYPLFASLDINAKMQEGALGRKMWESCLKTSISARKKIAKYCSLIKPFIPEKVNGKNWEKAATENIMSNIDYWKFRPEEKWHGFSEYEKEQYFIDPFKLILTTPGINTENDTYLDFGIPAAVLTCFLKEHGIIAEKNNLNSILFLMTPAEDEIKIDNLITRLLQFEHYIHTDAPLEEVLPELYSHYAERYNGYTIKQLCQEMHDMYKFHDSKELQKFLFLKAHFPVQNMSPKAANIAFKKGHSKLVKVSEIKGETALEGALPYPPGIFCVVPGEVWNEHAQSYFLALEECINRFPGLAPEIQGVYFEQHHNHIAAFAYVYDKQTFT